MTRQQLTYYFRRIGLVWAACLLMLMGSAQETHSPYSFDGNEVVFVFDIRIYAKELLGENALKVDFADLGIYDVAVTGTFNNWNKKGWKMVKRDEFTFELRKRIPDFNDAFPMDFRYIINGRYIADPSGAITDPKQFHDDFLEDIYKVDLSVIRISDEGNVRFFLKGYAQAREVILAGSFNGWKEPWNEQAIRMNRVDDGWEIKADLPPGRYEYKFIVDGEWMHDPASKDNVVNEHQTLNSVLYVTQSVVFRLAGYPDAKNVILAGSFNDWNEKKHRMAWDGTQWITTLPLYGGKHTYKFIVDGVWITDPANPVIEDDGYGNKNSVRFVH